MSDPKVIIEGEVKHRDTRKWKSRWCVLSKLSPVADCLHIQLYRDSRDRCKNSNNTKASLSLENFLAMESGFTLDKESNTLTLICSELEVVLAFDSRETLIQWQTHFRNHLPEGQQFLVQVTHIPPKSRITCGPARLHLQNRRFCLVTGVPGKLSGTWQMIQLRKFGIVDGKFCFEGGSQCGRGEGLHVLHTNQSSDLAQAFELSAAGRLSSKRKPHRKVQHTESCTCWMSSQGLCSRRNCASDSGRKLLSSESDGSTSEVCSEILRFSSGRQDGINDLEDSSSTRSACITNMRWSSSTNESIAGYVSPSNSVDSDSNSTALSFHYNFTSCDNPYLQNYDVPRKPLFLAECKLTNRSTTTATTTASQQDCSSLKDNGRFSPDLLSLQLAKELDLSCDDRTAGSSTESTQSSCGTHLHSYCSTCSSLDSACSSSVFAPSSQFADCVPPSAQQSCDHPMFHSKQHQQVLQQQHYQVPRHALKAGRQELLNPCQMMREQRPCSPEQRQNSTTTQDPTVFYAVPKNLKIKSCASIT